MEPIVLLWPVNEENGGDGTIVEPMMRRGRRSWRSSGRGRDTRRIKPDYYLHHSYPLRLPFFLRPT